MSTAWEQYQEKVKAELSRVYSDTVVDHIMNPRNNGRMENADGSARITGPCGDTMEIWLKARNDTITEASFITDGCATTIVSGSMVTELARGKSIAQALGIGQVDVLSALDGLPEDSQHCALLAANTLNEAARNYLAFKKEPWKKAYRK